jgi:hypothetical protein
MEYTLSYSEGVAGWVSFYSYYPDWLIGMNNYLYTFKGGNIYRHNVNQTRNTFYQPWWNQVDYPINPSPRAFKPSLVKSVFNNSVLENKLFKTLNLEGDSIWDAVLTTDLEYSGFISASYFELKEASYFAYVRNNTSGQINLRSVNGIGNSLTVDNAGTGAAEVNFSISPLISIGSIISVGDYVYFGNLQFAGEFTAINVDLPNGINQIVVNNAMLTPLSIPIPSDVNYFFYIKNSVAESHGVLGHYCVFTLQNYSNAKIELFAVESEVMKSFP